MPLWHQISFQDASSSIMENMIFFYDYAMIFLTMIIFLILYLLIFMILNNFVDRNMFEGQLIEIIWTVVPIMFLVFLAIPSLKILYLIDENNQPLFTFKVIGHQWYWEYEYNLMFLYKDLKMKLMESVMEKDVNKLDLFRLLDVSNTFLVPMNCQIRLLILSEDVIHSFTVPSLGFKIDAVPGRMNQVNLNINRPGLFYGQCSEICGVNHSFMPVVIESLNLMSFIKVIQKE